MHGMCMFHAWNLVHFMHIPCVVVVHSMHGTGIFHAWYRCISCVVQVDSMLGTGVFYAWYSRVCVYRVWYCNRYSYACIMYSTGYL